MWTDDPETCGLQEDRVMKMIGKAIAEYIEKDISGGIIKKELDKLGDKDVE